MPNHIKNKLVLKGKKEDVEEIVKSFSTYFERKVSTSYNDELVYKKQIKGDSWGKIGWLDTKTGVFTFREGEPVIGVPEGFELQYEEAWTRFPCFDKIISCPKILEDFNPHHKIVDAVKKVYNTPLSDNPLLAMMQSKNREKQTIEFEGEDKELFERGCKAYEETGYVYWYDWNLHNWGTKWNSYSCNKLEENIYEFDTAWNGVPDLIVKISERFPNVKIIYKFADEDTGNNCGSFIMEKGLVSFKSIINQSKEAYELAFELRPYLKDLYKLEKEEYKYIEGE